MPTEREYFEELRDVTFAKAKADGLEIIIPGLHQIQLDIDRPWPLEQTYLDRKVKEVRELIHNRDAKMISVLFRFDEEFSIERHEAWRSAGGNIHVMLTLNRKIELQDRIALQAILGSDPMRELCNLRRARCSAEDPIALFRPVTATQKENRSSWQPNGQ